MKNKIFAILLMIILAVPSFAYAEVVEQDTGLVNEEQVIDDSQASDIIENQNAPVLDEDLSNTQYKKPISKRKIAKKFLAAMFGVVMSSLIIYAGLTVYNRFRDGNVQQSVLSGKRGDGSLETPDNLTDSIKTFLDKTRWD